MVRILSTVIGNSSGEFVGFVKFVTRVNLKIWNQFH